MGKARPASEPRLGWNRRQRGCQVKPLPHRAVLQTHLPPPALLPCPEEPRLPPPGAFQERWGGLLASRFSFLLVYAFLCLQAATHPFFFLKQQSYFPSRALRASPRFSALPPTLKVTQQVMGLPKSEGGKESWRSPRPSLPPLQGAVRRSPASQAKQCPALGRSGPCSSTLTHSLLGGQGSLLGAWGERQG